MPPTLDRSSDRDAPEPRPASTVVMIRDSSRGPEVLLTVRPRHLKFMGGATVFPGGAVAAADRDPRWEGACATSAGAASALVDEPDERLALGYLVCALRESFEEVGLLLASGPVYRVGRGEADDPARFAEACIGAGVVLRTDVLAYAGRWVTPLGAPVRFDARFFLARVPDGWEPVPDEREVAACHWARPSDVLGELGRGGVMMAPPTVEMLQRLAEYPTADEMLAFSQERRMNGPGDVLTARLSPNVQVVLAPNPSAMTGPGTNTYVVGGSPSIVIDPAVEDEGYLDALVAAAGEVETILITHRHPDHIGGIPRLVARTGAGVRAHGDAAIGGIGVTPLADGDVVTGRGVSLRALHTPGHAPDHLCFLLEGAASLFSGDNILGEGTAVIAPPEGDMAAYLDSLRRLLDLDIDRIYPGHFRPLDGGRAVIAGYIAHRQERQEQIEAALASGAETIEEVVAAVYVDTPAQLHPVAAQQVMAQLQMMESLGIVERIGERWQRVRR